MSTDIEIYADDELLSANRLPRSARRAFAKGDDYRGITVQWASDQSTRSKKRVLFVLLAHYTAWDSWCYLRSNCVAEGPEAFTEFMARVDGDEWWLGDVVLIMTRHDTSIAGYPDSDGAFIEIAVAGARRESAYTLILDRLTSALQILT